MNPELIILFFAAVPIGIFGIVVGGNASLSFPLFQMLFPEMTLGAIVGNTKPGSLLRNITSIIPLRKEVDFRIIGHLLIPLVAGSTVGAFFVADMSQAVILPMLIVGFFIVEFSKVIAKYISKSIYLLATFLTGMYGGVFGAGISLLIVALMQIKNPEDTAIYKSRANALFLEIFFTATAVSVFISKGLLVWNITFIWIAGSILGGFLGGIILKKTGKLSGRAQRNILRTAFIFAIGVAILKLF